MGIFRDLFDLNGDGQLDSMEKAVEFGAFMQMIDLCQKDELTSAGLDMNELELMDEAERREVIESAGLDPDDYE